MTIEQISLIRLYVNCFDDPAKLWSVDFGPGSIELQTATVFFDAYGYTAYSLEEEDHTNKPKAWLEFISDGGQALRLLIIGNSITITK